MTRMRMTLAGVALSPLLCIAQPDINRCLGVDGIGQESVTNLCEETIRLNFRRSVLDLRWISVDLRPAEKRSLNSYALPFVACPLSRDGRTVGFNADRRSCVLR